jgi:hypothetical protein
MRKELSIVLVGLFLAGCSAAPEAGGGAEATGGSSSSGKGGTGGTRSTGSGGAPGPSGSGGTSAASGGTTGSGSGGAPAQSGSGGAAVGEGGSFGAADAMAEVSAPAPDASAADSGMPQSPMTPPSAEGQGPAAEGSIKYTNDFEEGFKGMTLSPTNLPPERIVVVDDPIGKRGKVASVTWQAGDNYRTSSGTEPRSWFSAAKVNQITPGMKASLAWGMMWKTVNMNAFFGQTIGPGPVWMLRIRADGTLNTLCNQCGGNQDHFKIEPNRWYDFKVNMDWQSGGAVRFYVNGMMIREAKFGGVSANCHWDGGIYWSKGSTKGTRTVYLSNLSIGER